MAIYTEAASNPKYVVHTTSIYNIRAARSVRMILEVFCMQFDTYAPCMCRGYRSFLSSTVFSHRSTRIGNGHGLTREAAATVNRCIRPGLSRPRAFMTRAPTSRLEFFWPHVRRIILAPFFRPSWNAPLAFWRFRVRPIKWTTTAWMTSEIEISRTVPGYARE